MDKAQIQHLDEVIRNSGASAFAKAVSRAMLTALAFGEDHDELALELVNMAATVVARRVAESPDPADQAVQVIQKFAGQLVRMANIDREEFRRVMMKDVPGFGPAEE